MKRVAYALLLTILLLSFELPVLTIAEGEGPSASGSFQLSLENGQSRDIKFDARAKDGNISGEITFRDTGAVVTDPKTTTDTDASETLQPFYAKASCDCLVVEGVEAALSGTVTESSRKSFIGRRVVLVVEDGDSLTPPLRDKLTFGFYKTIAHGLGATDSERPEDQGTVPDWVATDAERPDDIGVLSKKNEAVTCTSFPISSYTFLGAKQGKGKIQVTR